MSENWYEEAQKELEGELSKLLAHTPAGGLPDFLDAVANAVAARADWLAGLNLTTEIEGQCMALGGYSRAHHWHWVARELRKLARDPHTLKS